MILLKCFYLCILLSLNDAIITILVVPQVILPYIVFNSSISTVTNITRHYFYSTWRVNAPRPITLLGSAYPSIYVSLVFVVHTVIINFFRFPLVAHFL